MSGLSFTKSDMSSIRAVASRGRIAGAARGTLSADGGDRHEPLASSIDRAIRLSTAEAVLAVAAIAALSPTGMPTRSSARTARQGSSPGLEPATIDGLVYASSMAVLYAARHRVPVPSLARWPTRELNVGGKRLRWLVDDIGAAWVVHHDPPLSWVTSESSELWHPMPYRIHDNAHKWWGQLERLVKGKIPKSEWARILEEGGSVVDR